jgi:hypothetical protein
VRPTFLRPRRRLIGGLLVSCALVGLLILPARAGAPLLLRGTSALPPEITLTITGTLGLEGWYRSDVTIDWQVVGETASSGCDTVTLTADTPGTKFTCTAQSGPDETIKSVTIKLDKTAPAASAAADRAPDANGWYNSPLTVTSSGTDAMSGMGACSSAEYAGPDNASAVVKGTCTDRAGNTAETGLPIKYDATAPWLSRLHTRPRTRAIELVWRKASDTRVVEIVRTPGRNGAAETLVFRGLGIRYRDKGLAVGRQYQYRVTVFDQARNGTEKAVEAIATGALLKPGPGQTVGGAPRLVWAVVERASYYNLQLLYRGRKVLSAWPARHTFQLRQTWRYKGRRYRLQDGGYRWYVWPGFGRITSARYGRMLGTSTFVVSQ